MLTGKQQRFVDEYLIDHNATQAAIKAGYSQKTAYSQGQRLLKNVEIQTEISNRQAVISQKANIDAEFIVNEYLEIIKSSKQEGLDGSGVLKDRTNWSKAVAGLSSFLGLGAAEKKEIEHKGEVSGFQIKIIPPKNEE